MNDSHSLSVHRFLLRAGLSLGNIFAWILIFHALYFGGETPAGALIITALAYAATQFIIFFLTPISSANLPHGTARSMLCATLAQAAAFFWIAAASIGILGGPGLSLWWGILGFVILSAVYRAFYWVPYKVAAENVGRSWSPQTRFLLEVFLALMPIAAAIVISMPARGTWLLFTGAAAIAFFSVFPLIRIADTYERFDWNFSDTIEALFVPINKRVLSNSFLEGVQGAGLLFIWPLTIFILLEWSYLALGIIVSMTLLCALLLRKVVRNKMQQFGVAQSANVSAALAASSWVLRLVFFSPLGIVVADTLYHIGVPVRRFGMDPIAYEQASDSAHYLDEYTALKEMGSALGRIALCLVLVVLALFISPLFALTTALILAAGASVVSIMRAESARAPY